LCIDRRHSGVLAYDHLVLIMIDFITSISGRSLYRTCSLQSNNVLGGDLEFILLPSLFTAEAMLQSHTGPILPIGFFSEVLNMFLSVVNLVLKICSLKTGGW